MNNLDIEKINDQFYIIRIKGCNIGVCIKNNCALIIDSGFLPKKSALVKKILEENFNSKIKLLFNTHYHSDHTFGNQSFECPILASETCKNIMKENLTTFWTPLEIKKDMEEDTLLSEEWENLKITFPTMTFKNKKTYNFKGIRVIFQRLGGHTKGSSIAYFPDYGLIFSGDIVFGEIYPILLYDGNPLKLVKALQKITGMDVDIIIPGHGTTCDKSMVGMLVEYWQSLISECKKLIVSDLNNEEIKGILVNRCHLQGVPMNMRRHRINIGSVLKFFRGFST